jgi:hypothetical protein
MLTEPAGLKSHKADHGIKKEIRHLDGNATLKSSPSQRMKSLKFTVFFIIYGLLLLEVNGLRAQTDDRPRLLALEKRRFQSMIYRDTVQLSAMLGDSLIFIHSSGIIDNKQSFIKDISSGHITYIFIYPEKVTAVVDGNSGWIYGRANIRFKLSTMTTTIDQYISFVEVYQFKRNQWQMVLCQNARIEKDAPWYNNMVPQVKSGSVPSIY